LDQDLKEKDDANMGHQIRNNSIVRKHPQQQARTRVRKNPPSCYKCHRLGHIKRNCRVGLDVHRMMYEEMYDHFEQQRAQWKDTGSAKKREEKARSGKNPLVQKRNKYEGLPVGKIEPEMRLKPEQVVDTTSVKTPPKLEKSEEEEAIEFQDAIERSFVRTLRSKQELMISIRLCTMDTHHMVDMKVLLDSGATGMFIDKKFAEGNGITMRLLDKPIRVHNVDGTLNQGGSITHEVTLMLSHKGHKEKAVFKVCDLGKSTVIIGYTWLQKHNLTIDWKTGDIKFTRCPRECNVTTKKRKQKKASAFKYKASIEEVDDDAEEEEMECEDDEEMEDDIYLQVLEYIREVDTKDKKKRDEEMVPPQFHVYLDVFKKAPSERLPMRKPWDHTIDLNPNFIPQKSKLYPMFLMEQQKVRDFIDNQLKKEYIRPTKSPQTSPVFFIPKKDGKKQMVQDYRYLNKGTIKNNYPLPLIPELIDRIGDAKVFTKLDLRWGYNNVRIKEGDEWKAAFTCQDGTFEPLVMFFGLCNSPGTFQTNILIFTKTKEGHDEIVEEVLRRLCANDLFLKPEKCFFKQ